MRKSLWTDRSRVLYIGGLGLMVILTLGTARAYADKPTTHEGEIPVPFNLNQTVELADGEGYQLLGRIYFVDDRAFFLVSLEEHRWLANAKRVRAPYYLIENHPKLNVDLRDYDNRPVVIKVRAKSILMLRQDKSVQADVKLILLAEPEKPRRN